MDYQKLIDALNKSIASNEKLIKNTVDPEVKERVQTAIDEKRAMANAIQAMLDEADNDDEDKTAELLSKIEELQKRVEEITNNRTIMNLEIENYINSKKAIADFNAVVENSRNATEFKNNWHDMLVKNNITPVDSMLPGSIVSDINDTFTKTADNFMDVVDITGLKVLKVLTDTGNEGAHGHTKGSIKTEQTLTFTSKEIRPMIVYKYITIDRETILEDESGVLVRYIARELAARIMQTIISKILGTYKGTDLTKIETIRAAGDGYVSTDSVNSPTKLIQSAANIEGDKVAIMTSKMFGIIRSGLSVTGVLTREDVASALDVDRLVITNLSPAHTVTILRKGAYKMVGDFAMDSFNSFNLAKNSNEFLTEVYVGGALAEPNSAMVINYELEV